MTRPEPTDEYLFLQEEPQDVVLSRHLVYLHENWTLILKTANYEFSPRCHISEGGFVRYVWGPYTSCSKIIREARAMGTPEERLSSFAELVGLK